MTPALILRNLLILQTAQIAKMGSSGKNGYTAVKKRRRSAECKAKLLDCYRPLFFRQGIKDEYTGPEGPEVELFMK